MSVSAAGGALLLPPRARLLHIGPMKTGTTSVQAAASARRRTLLEHGVRYPGRGFNHRQQLGALMGFSVDTWRRAGPPRPDLLDVDTKGIPARTVFDQLRAEMDADPDRRIFLTHEFVSQADDGIAQRVVEGIGAPLHVCITLRAPGQIVPSLWTQSITDDAQADSFEAWLDRLYRGESDRPMSAASRNAYDQDRLVQRWARLVGSQNVTVVVVDKDDPDLLTGAFEQMLGLPTGLLGWNLSNRSLTAVEAELFRQVNAELLDRGVSWSTLYHLVWKGAIRFGPGRRPAPADEPRVRLPAWAADIADRDGRRFADAIAEIPVRVVGDLGSLATPADTAEWAPADVVPIGLAADAVAAAVWAGGESRVRFGRHLQSRALELRQVRADLAEEKARTLYQFGQALPPARRVEELTTAFTSHELAAALKRRLLHKLRTRRSLPHR